MQNENVFRLLVRIVFTLRYCIFLQILKCFFCKFCSVSVRKLVRRLLNRMMFVCTWWISWKLSVWKYCMERKQRITGKFSIWSRSFRQSNHVNISYMEKMSDLFHMKFLLHIIHSTSWIRTDFHITTCSCIPWYPVLILQEKLAIYEDLRAKPKTSSTQTDSLNR